MVMSPKELNEAILGAKYREQRELTLPRLIAWLVGRYIDYFKKGTKITDIFPFEFDYKKEKIVLSDADQARRKARLKKREEIQRKRYLESLKK